MKFKTTLFAVILFFSVFANAVLNLDPPDILLKKAATDRQQLRDAVLSMELQLPEMRDIKTFESYFFICDQLKIEADRLGLDDIYPDAVKSLATKMASFGVKWLDVSLSNQTRLAYYLKWMDVDAISNLLSYTSYYAKKITDLEQLKKLASNVDFIIGQTEVVIKDRFDVVIGYRELSSSIAIKFLLSPTLSNEEKKYWADKIYTSQGLSLYTDQMQQLIYGLNSNNKTKIHEILSSLDLCYQISNRLIDSPTSFNYERINDLLLETLKKSFELEEKITNDEVSNLLGALGPKHLQALSYFLISSPDVIIYKNSDNLLYIGKNLMAALSKANLTTEALNLNLFLGKVSASLVVNQLDGEGTYQLTDKSGNKWFFSILRIKPFEMIAAFANENWNITKGFYSVRYSADDNTFVANESSNEIDTGGSRLVLTFKLLPDHKIEVSNIYGSDQYKFLTGSLVEKTIPQVFSQKLTTPRLENYEGMVTFKNGAKPSHVELTIQSDGVTTAARLSDSYGLVYEFTSGYFNDNGDFNLTTGRLQTTWAQIRGSLKDDEIKGQIIVGGRGIVAKDFVLKRKK